MVMSQANLFLIFVINGLLIGLLFDVFRILRKSFKTSDLITILQDMLFWIITGIIILYSIFVFNNGEIRFFMFIGIFLGTGLYILVLSRYVIKVSVTIITILKKIISFILKIILFPLQGIHKVVKKLIKRPILFCFINTKKIIRQISTKILKNRIKNRGN